MNTRIVHQAVRRVSSAVLPMLTVLVLAAGFLAAQAIISAGPPALYQVNVIYVAPSTDDFVGLLKSRLEKWNAVRITSQPEEADAILTCQTQSTFVPAKVVVRRTTAEVTLVERRSQKVIWRTTKIAAFDTTILADDIMEQLKQDRRKSASVY